MTDQKVIETQNHLEMIKRHHLWKCYGGMFLPLKRYKKGNLELGIIFFMDKTTVILDNLFEYPHRSDTNKLQVPKIKYSSIENLLADSWIVD